MSWRALVLSLGLLWVFLGSVAAQPQMPAGSKNFTPPGNVPNYFSNEAGAIRGSSNAGPPPGATYAVPTARPRSYVSTPRYAHVARGRYRVVERRRYVSRRGRVMTRGHERRFSHAVHGHTAAGRRGGRRR